MKHKVFDKFLKSIFSIIEDTLGTKASEYSRGGDKLYNFKRAGEIRRCTPEMALFSMYIKHFTSVQDIVEGLERDGKLPPYEVLEEKFKDSINYHILLWALLKERIEKGDTK